MAKWTADDLESVQSAITELATGKHTVVVDLGGRQESYGIVRLPELVDLRDRIKAEIDAAKTSNRRPRVYRTTFKKGI
jgi:hypothetical protein